MTSELPASSAEDDAPTALARQLAAAQAELAALGKVSALVPRGRTNRRGLRRRPTGSSRRSGSSVARLVPKTADKPGDLAKPAEPDASPPVSLLASEAREAPPSAEPRRSSTIASEPQRAGLPSSALAGSPGNQTPLSAEMDQRLRRLEEAVSSRPEPSALPGGLEQMLERLAERLTSLEEAVSQRPVLQVEKVTPPPPPPSPAPLVVQQGLDLLPLEPEASEAFLAPGELSVPTLAELEEELGLFHTDLAQQVFSEVGSEPQEVFSESRRGHVSMSSLSSPASAGAPFSPELGPKSPDETDDAAALFDVSQASDDWSGAGWEGGSGHVDTAPVPNSPPPALGAGGGPPLAPSPERTPIRAQPQPSWISTRESLPYGHVDYSIPEALSEVEDPNAARAALLSAPVLSDSEPWARRAISEAPDQLASSSLGPMSDSGSSVGSRASEPPRSSRSRRGRKRPARASTPAIDSLLQLARGLARSGSTDALALYDQVLSAEPSHAEAVAGRAQVLIANGRTAEVFDDLDRAVAATPDNVHLLTARGQAYRSLEQWSRAHADLHRAWELVPSDALETELADLEKRLGSGFWR